MRPHRQLTQFARRVGAWLGSVGVLLGRLWNTGSESVRQVGIRWFRGWQRSRFRDLRVRGERRLVVVRQRRRQRSRECWIDFERCTHLGLNRL